PASVDEEDVRQISPAAPTATSPSRPLTISVTTPSTPACRFHSCPPSSDDQTPSVDPASTTTRRDAKPNTITSPWSDATVPTSVGRPPETIGVQKTREPTAMVSPSSITVTTRGLAAVLDITGCHGPCASIARTTAVQRPSSR